MQRCDNLVDLDKWSKMTFQLQKSVPIQPRTSLVKFDGLAAKSEKDTVSYLSTKVSTRTTTAARPVAMRTARKGGKRALDGAEATKAAA